MHHDERYWNDPWRFEPERFLGEDGCVLQPDHPDRRRYFFSHFSNEREVIAGSLESAYSLNWGAHEI